MGTAFQYFKRFYLNNSVMDYHPRDILVTCAYLACKVEEFNVSMDQFVMNIKGDQKKATDIVLNNELLLMQQLRYHLTVHNPFRPIEGLLIDIKTRCLTAGDPDKFRPHMEYFVEKTHFTDACLLYSPSQIALAAIIYAASKCGVDLDSYLTGILLADAPEKLDDLREMMKSLWIMIKSMETPVKDQVKVIEKKLEKCRNQGNNPDSQEYKRALQDALQEEDGEPMRKYIKLSQESLQRDEALVSNSQ
jgi:cyclin H